MTYFTPILSKRKNTLIRLLPFCLLLIWLNTWVSVQNQAQAQGVEKTALCLENATTPLAIMECFRSLPYRTDGALDEQGRWTYWANPQKERSSAGLNCSGLVTAISRELWQQNLSLDSVKRDRLNDSGTDAPMGEDWDFGLDLILNLTDDLPRRLIPDPCANSIQTQCLWSAHNLRGMDVDSPQFAKTLAQLQADKIYYFVISKPDRRFKGGVSFYHVGLILKEGEHLWMYHATAKGGVYRVNLAGDRGLNWFRRYYGASPRGPRYIQFIEIPLSASQKH